MMITEKNYIPKKDVSYCLSGMSLKAAYDIFEKVKFRAIPLLDKDEINFLGVIYKEDVLNVILKKEKNWSDLVDDIARETHYTIHKGDSFYTSFPYIKKSKFVTVVDDHEHFLGIMTNAHLIQILEVGMGIDSKGYRLTVAINEVSGVLFSLAKIVRDFGNIRGITTFDSGENVYRRIVFTVSFPLFQNKTLEQLIQQLELKSFRLLEVEKIGI